LPGDAESKIVGSNPGQAGCSGTPLAQKLGIKPKQRLLLYNPPPGWSVPALPQGTIVTADAPRADVAVAFFYQAADLVAKAPALVAVVKPYGSLWVAWPRRAGGHTSDLTDSVLRETLLPLGVVDVKIAALDRDWSGLKFVWRRQLRS
jgi:hypothetical protein